MASNVEFAAEIETGQICSYCNEAIHVAQEIVLLKIVEPDMGEKGVETVDYTDDDNDYLYDPYTFHRDCWAEVYHDHESLVEDEKPVGSAGSLIECAICSSDILRLETTAEAVLGELHISPRRPNHERAFRVVNEKDRLYLCIQCIVSINEKLELWDGLDHSGECAEGIITRCWRRPGCENHCKLEVCTRCKGGNIEAPDPRWPAIRVCKDCGQKVDVS